MIGKRYLLRVWDIGAKEIYRLCFGISRGMSFRLALMFLELALISTMHVLRSERRREGSLLR